MAYPGDSRIQQTQNQVDDVVGVMRNNLQNMLERDVKLSDLDQRTDRLEDASRNFQVTSRKVKKKMWWEDMKMKLIIGGVVTVTVLIIVIVIIVHTSGDSNDNTTTKPVDGDSQN